MEMPEIQSLLLVIVDILKLIVTRFLYFACSRFFYIFRTATMFACVRGIIIIMAYLLRKAY